MVEVFSAGNDGDGKGNPLDPKGDEGYGSITAPGTAKNVITVGAAESVRGIGHGRLRRVERRRRQRQRHHQLLEPRPHAGRAHEAGPRGARHAHHGRVAAARRLHRHRCVRQDLRRKHFYSLVSGTSQAAPQVAGAAALLRDWYVRQVDPTPPSPALTKAILVNTAVDVAGGDSGKNSSIPAAPNSDEGWGRVSIGAALDATQREYLDQGVTTTLDATGQSVLRSYQVDDTAKPVRVTLAWTDPPPARSPATPS